MDSIWYKVVWNNTIRDWTIAMGIVIMTMLILRIIQSVVIARIQQWAQTTKSDLDDFIIALLRSSVMQALYLFSLYLGIQYLKLPPQAGPVFNIAMMIIITFFFLRLLTAIVSYFFRKALNRQKDNELRHTQARGILLIIQIFIWTVGILFLIDNLGYDITTVIAGLGIGGIAIALAAQAILGDLFSYLVIFFDKPFEIGDFIVVDEKKGTVEYIGLKTSRIRSLTGELLIFSNTDLTNSRVHNYKRMEERRITFSFGVVYDTPKAQLYLIPGWIKGIVLAAENTRFDRAHFFSFGDYSLNFEVVYYVLSSDYNQYMDIQQHINMQIFELFDQQGVEFAFPTQTLYIGSSGVLDGNEKVQLVGRKAK